MKTLKAAPPRETLAVVGQLVQIRYRHPESDWRIGLAFLETPTGRESCTIVGALDTIPLRQSQTFYGYWETHEKFGRQFHCQAATAPAPQSADGMVRYLATARCPHLGPKTAEKLVAAFGADTLTVLREHPDQVSVLKGLTSAKATAWQAFFTAQRGADDIIVWLLQWDIDPSVARRLYAQYGPQAMARVQDNPYQLTQDTWGVGFHTADRMALSMGWAPLSPERLAAVWRFGLDTALTQGDCYQTTAQLQDRAQTLLTDQDPSMVQAALTPLIPAWTHQPAWAYDPATDRWQLPSVQHQERALSHQVLRHQAQASGSSTPIDWVWLETRADVQYAPAQRAALQQALNTPFSIVTGGPGTGKTTLLQGLLQWLLHHQGVPPDRVALTAPTARAAQRMKAVTGHEALTIHRLLEWSAESGQFTRQADNPLDVDWLIADEVSMIDLPLAQALWQATAPTTHVLWIGDAHQLPSVGPGSVLHDLITSGRFPVTALTHNFRSASSIAAAAHAWLHESIPQSTDAVQVHRYPNQQPQTLLHWIGGIDGYHLDWLEDTAHLWQSEPVTTPFLRLFPDFDALYAYANAVDDVEWMGRCRLVERWGRRLPSLIRRVQAASRHPDQATVAFATIHKAKGLEWPHVVILDDMAPLDETLSVEDQHLWYVAVTRATHTLGVPETAWLRLRPGATPVSLSRNS